MDKGRGVWLLLALGAAGIVAGAGLVTVAVYEHAEVIRAVRVAGSRAVSFPTDADRVAGWASVAVLSGAVCVFAAVVGAWLWVRRVAVTVSLVAVAVVVPFGLGVWAVTVELRQELHTYETQGVRLPHPPPKR